MGVTVTRVRRALSAAKRSWLMARPAGGQIVKSDPRIDQLAAAISDSLNFSLLRSMLWAADSGDLAQGLQLFDEMERKDGTLKSVARTRTKALTGLPYEIVSAAEVEDVAERKLADEAADFLRDAFAKIVGVKKGLKHLAKAIGSNLAVGELVWEGNQIVKIVEVAGRRLRMDYNEPGVVRVMTADDRVGIAAQGPKWVVHVPESAAGYPLTQSIFRAQAFVYLVKALALADWVVFCEIFGMPIRIAKYAPSATPEEKEELIEMMTNLGSKAFGVFSQAVTLEFIESSQRGTAPFKDLIEWCDRTQAKVWLGGNLTADTTGGTGTLAAATVQDEVREDLRDDDIENEGDMVRERIFAPMCLYEFWREVPLPYFRRIKPETVDRSQEGEVIVKAQATGLTVGEDWARDRLGIPKPKDDERVLQPPDAWEAGVVEGVPAPSLEGIGAPPAGAAAEETQAATINELTLGIERAVKAGDLGLVNILRRKIATLLGVDLPDLTELPKTEEGTGGGTA